MYESTFQLEKRPFVAVPSAEFYFPAESIETARVSLERLIERDEGPAMVIGPVGIGKSMLSQLLAQTFRSRLRIALIPSARICTRRTLLQVILHQFGLPYQGLEEGELRLSLIDHVTSKDFCPHGVLMLVDEADALPMLLIDELRTMTNIISAGESCVRLILFGSSRLEEKMAHPRLESLNQRLAGRFYIEPFDLEETIDYVNAHFEQCGGIPEDVFSEDALQTIYTATNGVPRLINQLCDHALILAAIDGQTSIDRDLVNESWADLQQLPTPTFSRSHATSNDSDFIEFGELETGIDSLEDSVADRLDDIEHTVEELHEAFDFEGEDRPTLRVHCDPIDDEAEQEELESAPTSQLAENPFDEEFEEEIVVTSGTQTADLLAKRNERTVTCDRSEKLSTYLDIEPSTDQTSKEIDEFDGASGGENFTLDDDDTIESDSNALVDTTDKVQPHLDEPATDIVSAEQEIIQQLQPIEMTDGYSLAEDLEYKPDAEDSNNASESDTEASSEPSVESSTIAAENASDPTSAFDDLVSEPPTSIDEPATQQLDIAAETSEQEYAGSSQLVDDVESSSDEHSNFEDESLTDSGNELVSSPTIATNVEEINYECQVEFPPIVVDVEQTPFDEQDIQPEEAEQLSSAQPTTPAKDPVEIDNSERLTETAKTVPSCATATLPNSVDSPETASQPEKSPNQKFRRLFLKLKHAT